MENLVEAARLDGREGARHRPQREGAARRGQRRRGRAEEGGAASGRRVRREDEQPLRAAPAGHGREGERRVLRVQDEAVDVRRVGHRPLGAQRLVTSGADADMSPALRRRQRVGRCLGIPEADGAVVGARDEQVGLGQKRHVGDRAGVAEEHPLAYGIDHGTIRGVVHPPSEGRAVFGRLRRVDCRQPPQPNRAVAAELGIAERRRARAERREARRAEEPLEAGRRAAVPLEVQLDLSGRAVVTDHRGSPLKGAE